MDFSGIHKSAKIDESLLLGYDFSVLQNLTEESFALVKKK